MRRVDGDGYFVEWESEDPGYARVVVKAAASPEDEAAEAWLPEDEWLSYEFHGPDAFEEALKATLDDLWPDRTPYRIP